MGKIEEKKNLLLEKKKELLFQNKKINDLKDKNQILNVHDIYGDDNPSLLFPLILNRLGYLLDSQDMKDFSEKEIKKRKSFNALIRKIGSSFLKTKQIYEDRNELMDLPNGTLKDPVIPDSPIIFVANHMFRDDILGTVLAAGRHAYVVFGSVPQFYNTIDGLLLFGNGVVLVNRKVKKNKKSSIAKSEAVLNNGGNLIIFPEGVWNKSPNQLSLPLWNGVYRIAKETGAKIVPIVHYINDETYQTSKKDNSFHTVIDDVIDPTNMTEEEVLNKIRDSFSTWSYLMMEKYGNTTRKELLAGYDNSQSAWEDRLRKRILTADKYDYETEISSDFVPKDVSSTYDVFKPLAEMSVHSYNVQDVLQAKKLVKGFKENDFQHKF